MFGLIKKGLYYALVERNSVVGKYYQGYVNQNNEFHQKNKLASWKYLYRLNKAVIKNETISYVALPEGASKPVFRSIKRAFSTGSESASKQRMSPLRVATQFANYDVVSFNTFGTLVFLPFDRQNFILPIVGEKLGIRNYFSLRQRCEALARQSSYELNMNTGVSIYDIYRMVHEETGLDVEVGVRTEFETVLGFCYPNPYMTHVYKAAKSKKKRVICFSDTHFTREMIYQILDKCGFYPDDLFISHEHQDGIMTLQLLENFRLQGEGLHDVRSLDEETPTGNSLGESSQCTLFSLAADGHPPGTTFYHIDNRFYDGVLYARYAGWEALHYSHCNHKGNIHRPDTFSSLIGSAYRGMVNNELHNGVNKFTPYFEYGFIYGGLYILGFMSHLHNYCKANDLSKILFLSCGGSLYQQAYSKVFGAQGVGVETMLCPERFDLSCEKVEISMREYVESKVGDSKRVLLVDLGWDGSNLLSYKQLIEVSWRIECEIYCVTAAAVSSPPIDISVQQLQSLFPSYLLSQSHNRVHYDTHVGTRTWINNYLLSMFTLDCSPTFTGFQVDGELGFAAPAVGNYEYIRDIQKGLMHFIQLYHEHFTDYPYLLNISGYDAYLPFKLVTKSPKLIEENYSEFVATYQIETDILSLSSTEPLGSILTTHGFIEQYKDEVS